jgi:hypothetical protein
MKMAKTARRSKTGAKTKKAVVKTIGGHKPTAAYLAALKAVAAIGE